MAHALPIVQVMMTKTMRKVPRRSVRADPGFMLRWVFHRGQDALTCAVETTVDRSAYDVCVLPHWNLSVSTIERFDAPAGALRRHAEIASRLRQAGWVVQYGGSHPTGIAA